MIESIVEEGSRVANAYVDGFNFYKGAMQKRPEFKWMDLRKLCQMHSPNILIDKVYYFTAPVKNRFDIDSANERQHTYLRALQNSGVEIVRGSFRKNIDWKRFASKNLMEAIQPTPKDPLGFITWSFKNTFKKASPDYTKAQVFDLNEKGSDVNLASYLLRDTYTRVITDAIILTADSDQVTPIIFSKNFGVNVKVLVPGIGNNVDKLRNAANSLETVNVDYFPLCQLPKLVKTKKGTHIHRPKEWA